MRFLSGMLLGLLVVLGSLFLVNAAEVPLVFPDSIKIEQESEALQPVDLDVSTNDQSVTHEIDAPQKQTILEPTIIPPAIHTIQDDFDVAATVDEDLHAVPTADEAVVVRQGAGMLVAQASEENGHFISTTTGEPVTDSEASAIILPENIHLFIAETTKFRLTPEQVADFPSQVGIVIWPDSALAETGRPYYLLTPPLNLMDSYALKEVVNDEDEYYKKTFPSSVGIFVRDLLVLAESSEFTRAVYAQMAEKDKSLIMFSGYVDPKMNKIIDETQIDFRRIDFVIDQHHPSVGVDKQWNAIVEKARHGEELNILLEADEIGLSKMKASLGI